MEKGLGMEPQSVSEMAHVVSEMKRYASMPIHALAAPQTIPYAQYFLPMALYQTTSCIPNSQAWGCRPTPTAAADRHLLTPCSHASERAWKRGTTFLSSPLLASSHIPHMDVIH
jgi:hypothetical protein